MYTYKPSILEYPNFRKAPCIVCVCSLILALDDTSADFFFDFSIFIWPAGERPLTGGNPSNESNTNAESVEFPLLRQPTRKDLPKYRSPKRQNICLPKYTQSHFSPHSIPDLFSNLGGLRSWALTWILFPKDFQYPKQHVELPDETRMIMRSQCHPNFRHLQTYWPLG